MPILEYVCSVWDPYQQKYIDKIEKIQRAASRFVTNCRSNEPGCITEILESLQWQSLKARRQESRLKLLHSCIYGNSVIKLPEYIKPLNNVYNTRNHHPSKFYPPFGQINSFRFSFFPKAISDWNELPKCITSQQNKEQFSRELACYMKTREAGICRDGH